MTKETVKAEVTDFSLYRIGNTKNDDYWFLLGLLNEDGEEIGRIEILSVSMKSIVVAALQSMNKNDVTDVLAAVINNENPFRKQE